MSTTTTTELSTTTATTTTSEEVLVDGPPGRKRRRRLRLVSPPSSPDFSPSQYPTTTAFPAEEEGGMSDDEEEKEDVDIGSVEGEGDWSQDSLVVPDTLLPTIQAQPLVIKRYIYSFIYDARQTYAVLLRSCLNCRIMRFCFTPNPIHNETYMCTPSLYGNSDRLCKRFVCGRDCFRAQSFPNATRVLCYVHDRDF
jgi:hypothetical protein